MLLKTVLTYLLLFGLWVTIGIDFVDAATPPAANMLPDLVEKVSPCIANISSTRFVKQYFLRGMPEFFGMFGIPEAHVQKQSSLGSGFIIDANGYLLTNHHVIENAAEVVVTLFDKRRIPAKIIGKDRVLDLALLQLKGGATNKDIGFCALGSSAKMRRGESVFAIGNPFGLQNSVSAGIISAKDRAIGIGPLDNYLQTDASINFGNSGGPLFNFSGEVIGINTAINASGQGLGFAIPIDEARGHLDELKNFGYIVRSWLGILGEDITPAIQAHYDLPVEFGVVITRLSDRGPAYKNGLRPGDILVSINGQEIKETTDVRRVLEKTKPGQAVELSFNRQGRGQKKSFKLTPAPDSSQLPAGVI